MPRLVRYLLARAGLQSTPPARGEYRSSPYSDTQNLLQLHWEWRGEQAQGFMVTALVHQQNHTFLYNFIAFLALRHIFVK